MPRKKSWAELASRPLTCYRSIVQGRWTERIRFELDIPAGTAPDDPRIRLAVEAFRWLGSDNTPVGLTRGAISDPDNRHSGLSIEGRSPFIRAWHFPNSEDGQIAADGVQAVLEALGVVVIQGRGRGR